MLALLIAEKLFRQIICIMHGLSTKPYDEKKCLWLNGSVGGGMMVVCVFLVYFRDKPPCTCSLGLSRFCDKFLWEKSG